MPNGFYRLAERPPVEHRLVPKVLWFVLATGSRWEDVPPEPGYSGRAAQRHRPLWEELSC
jgi:hypothetical protein